MNVELAFDTLQGELSLCSTGAERATETYVREYAGCPNRKGSKVERLDLGRSA
jgi:hypothetical protein